MKNWLNDSYKVHGCSTSTGGTKSENNNDTPKAKVAAMGKKNTDMAKTKTKGNSSGGGSSSQRTVSAGNGGAKVKTIAGIVSSRKQ